MNLLIPVLLLLVAATPDTTNTPPGLPKNAVHGVPTPKPEERAMKQIDDQIAAAKIDKSKPDWRLRVPKPTVAPFDSAYSYYAVMETNKGSILIKFLPQVAPMHVTSFVYLARMGFYDGLAFHRVIPKFMAQGGDPVGNGTGGPGYQFGGEFSPSVKFDRQGLLAMANAGEGTDGSQFFLTFAPTPWLNGHHTIFGEVEGGMDALAALEAKGTPGGQTTEPLKIVRITTHAQ